MYSFSDRDGTGLPAVELVELYVGFPTRVVPKEYKGTYAQNGILGMPLFPTGTAQ